MPMSSSFLLSIAVAVDFGLQFLGFIQAIALKTEKFYDLCGSATYLILISFTFFCGVKGPRASIASALAAIWAFRLGVFLFKRVLFVGKDKRFDDAKENIPKFAFFWFLQGVWIYSTLMPVLLLNSFSYRPHSLKVLDYIGIFVWVIGFLIESIADHQKLVFKEKHPNISMWIESGLWGYSRHPNYFGEITLWIGMYLLSWNGLTSGLRVLAAISPVLTTTLLCFVSGIPILEANADKKWGDIREYQEYKKSVSILVPLPRCARSE